MGGSGCTAGCSDWIGSYLLPRLSADQAACIAATWPDSVGWAGGLSPTCSYGLINDPFCGATTTPLPCGAGALVLVLQAPNEIFFDIFWPTDGNCQSFGLQHPYHAGYDCRDYWQSSNELGNAYAGGSHGFTYPCDFARLNFGGSGWGDVRIQALPRGFDTAFNAAFA